MAERTRVFWVVEHWTGRTWRPAETISLKLAVYATRGDAKRDIHNGEISYGSKVRIAKYKPECLDCYLDHVRKRGAR